MLIAFNGFTFMWAELLTIISCQMQLELICYFLTAMLLVMLKLFANQISTQNVKYVLEFNFFKFWL